MLIKSEENVLACTGHSNTVGLGAIKNSSSIRQKCTFIAYVTFS